ncbi:hypothetical protein L208DRAFT_1330885 [Tricholoma matsutake]|nr:hypothetical protein L208DRAFT_1330885 [Tricholoma matsutake 945]
MKNHTLVHAAFICVHQHLDQHLTPADKEVLGFCPIFTEHLLCKVVQWSRHWKEDTHKSPEVMGTSIEEELGSQWEAGLNISDHTAFPFPLQATPQGLNKAIAGPGQIYHADNQNRASTTGSS